VTGISDGNWVRLVNDCLGVGAWDALMKSKKRSGEYARSGYAITLTKLRERFEVMPAGPGEPTLEQVHQYTRAYILDLFGSFLFTDSSGDSVPVMYLQFLRDLNAPGQFNWGGAVLAFLYRNLCWAVTRKAKTPKTISGPMILLQHWAWSRLPTGRPRPKGGWAPDWGIPDRESCPAFGAKWCGRIEYKQPHGTAGVKYFRSELQKLRESMVDWEPYKSLFDQMPLRVHEDSPFWRARVPLIHFWIVEHHYPDRVMRQFGFRQTLPVPYPLPEDEVRRLHKCLHKSGCTDWSLEHQTYVAQACEHESRLVPTEGPFSTDEIERYQRWFHNQGMYTVFLGSQYLDSVQPMGLDRDENNEIGHIASGPIHTRDVRTLYF